LDREHIDARPEVFDECADEIVRAQYLRDREHDVGRGYARTRSTREVYPDHLRNQHRHRFAERRRAAFETADAPTDDAQAVDHGRVAVHAEQGIRIGGRAAIRFLGPHDPCQALEIDLVADTRSRRNEANVVERLRAPAQKRVPLLVTLEFELHVAFERVGRAGVIGHDGMVDHEVDRHGRVDASWIAAQTHHGVPHGGHIAHERHAGRIDHQHAGGLKPISRSDLRRSSHCLTASTSSGWPVRRALCLSTLSSTTLSV
jgi:hypothetical protein